MIGIFAPLWRQQVNNLKTISWFQRLRMLGMVLFLLVFAATFFQVILSSMHLFSKMNSNSNATRLLLFDILTLVWLMFFPFLIYARLVSSYGFFFQHPDQELLAALPIKDTTVFWRNFWLGYVPILLFQALLLFPILAAYGIYFKAGVYFKIAAPLIIFLFSIPPQVLGVLIPLFLLRFSFFFKWRRFFYWISLTLVLGLVILWRQLWRYQFEFASGVDWKTNLARMMIYLQGNYLEHTPFAWSQNLIFATMFNQFDASFYFSGIKLCFLAIFSLGLLHFAAKYFYPLHLSLNLEGSARDKKRFFLSSLLQEIEFRGYFKKWQILYDLTVKDFLLFFRDASQWSQVLLLLFFFAAYSFVFVKISQEGLQDGSQTLLTQEFFIFFVSGLTQVTVGVRFIFPLFSLESRLVWIYKVAPIRPFWILLAKFIFGFFLINSITFLQTGFFLSQLKFSWHKIPYYFVAMEGSALLLVNLALYLGIRFQKKDFKNIAHLASSLGGVVYSTLGIIFVFLFAMPLAYPMAVELYKDSLWFLFLFVFSIFWGVFTGVGSLFLGFRSIQNYRAK